VIAMPLDGRHPCDSPRPTPAQAIDGLGRPLRDLRISVTDRCNFRCSYCMPTDAGRPDLLERQRLLTFEQITRVAAACAGLGVRKIRLTGGEPLLRRDLPDLLRQLAGIEGILDLALTTNGWRLAELAARLADAGLGRVTVSLDSLDDDVFRRMNGVGAPVDKVVAGIRAARSAGLWPVKINAVILRGVNEASVIPLARFARDEGLTLRLIEYMDVGQSNGWRAADVVPAGEMLDAVAAAFPIAGIDEPAAGAVATRYRYLDGAGEIGIIGAVTRPFCDGCSRLRLAADGTIYTCLFGERGHDLRQALAAGCTRHDLQASIATIWEARLDRYSAQRAQVTTGHRSVEMYRVGG